MNPKMSRARVATNHSIAIRDLNGDHSSLLDYCVSHIEDFDSVDYAAAFAKMGKPPKDKRNRIRKDKRFRQILDAYDIRLEDGGEGYKNKGNDVNLLRRTCPGSALF